MDALVAAGWRGSLFIVDDNFIGNLREVRKLVPEIAAWQARRGRPFELYTEASVNLADHDELVTGMVAAGFTAVFLGIETPSEAALVETQKTQNLRRPLAESVAVLPRAGLEVMGGFIVGFDADEPSAFELQRRFLADAPIPLAMVGLLTALPGTQLWRRLEREGRLRGAAESVTAEQMQRPNFDPAMDEEALLRGYARLLGQLYSADGYLRRCEAYLAAAPVPAGGQAFRPGAWRTLLRTIWKVGIVSPRRRVFWSLLVRAARRSRHHVYWSVVKAIQAEHFLRYTAEEVLPRVERAIADVRAERAASVDPADQRGGRVGDAARARRGDHLGGRDHGQELVAVRVRAALAGLVEARRVDVAVVLEQRDRTPGGAAAGAGADQVPDRAVEVARG
jgi:hypothetical protein